MPSLRRSGMRRRPGKQLRRAPLKSTASPSTRRQRSVSPASPAQREKCSGKPCVVCGHENGTVPMHVIDRSLGGDDDPRATVPGCPGCHRAYDTGKISLLEHLEPDHREELAYAVEKIGLLRALRRITNERWAPAE